MNNNKDIDAQRKINIAICAIGGIIFLVYAAVLITFVRELHPAGLIGIIFTVIAFILAFATPAFAVKRPKAEALFFGLPLIAFASRYFIVQVVVGAILLAAQKVMGAGIAFCIELIILAVFLIAMIVGYFTQSASLGQREERRQQQVTWTFRVTDVDGTMRLAQSKGAPQDVVNQLQHLVETVRYSDAFSHQNPMIMQMERQISDETAQLRQCVAAGDWMTTAALCRDLELRYTDRANQLLAIK